MRGWYSGANSASYSAWELGAVIAEDPWDILATPERTAAFLATHGM
jgi:hypothetical protein